jgi:hypothetical protein
MVYKNVIGYEGVYEVSEYGDIKRISKSKILKPQIVKGYHKLSLCQKSITKQHSVHRLVALAFIPNPLNKEQVNHIDGNKLNNHVSNLEWATPKENTNHAWDNGLIKTRIKQKQSASKTMIEYNQKQTIDLTTGVVFDSLKQACQSTNFNYQTAICQMYRKTIRARFQYV